MTAGIISGGVEGYWGPRTSTLDWCEENYIVCKYIAEFWNTLSNLGFICLALLGLYGCRKYGYDGIVQLSYLSLMMVGVGSWCFHGTLLYGMQLLDELPMVYGSCVFFFSCLELETKYRYGLGIPIALFLYSVAVTIAYLLVRNPILHQIPYGILVAGIVIRASQIASIRIARNPTTLRLVKFAIATYALAFLLWNIDNVACTQLRALRLYIQNDLPAWVPRPIKWTRFLLELHAWWHILTGVATYAFVVFTVYVREVVKKRGGVVDWKGDLTEKPNGSSVSSSNGAKKGKGDEGVQYVDWFTSGEEGVMLTWYCWVVPFVWLKDQDRKLVNGHRKSKHH